jgi:cleavage and polyadenylation specificity factor subunit 1
VKSKRVFVAASTAVLDKHGEDTQGEGRLMFFSLDYKLFDDGRDVNAEGNMADSAEPVAVGDDGEAMNLESATDNGAAESKNGGSGLTSSSKGATHTNGTASAPTAVNGDSKAGSGLDSAAQEGFLKSIQPKLKLQWQGPGPASVVKQFGEKILSTIGAHVYIYKLNPETLELDQLSFYFAQFYVSHVSVLNNYILLADVCNSVQFLMWREEDYSLTLLAKDFDRHVCLSSTFMWDGQKLGMLVGDDEKNIQLLQFNPRKIESIKGSRLLSLADFHVGSDVTLMLSHLYLTLPPAPPSAPLPPSALPMVGSGMYGRNRMRVQGVSMRSSIPFGSRAQKHSSTRSCTLVGSGDGSLGLLIPVEERMYRRLALLQQIMSMGIETPCALNPRDYRSVKTIRRRLEKKRGVLDGTLIWKYANLDTNLQEELAMAIGITPDLILDNLAKLDTLSQFF